MRRRDARRARHARERDKCRTCGKVIFRSESAAMRRAATLARGSLGLVPWRAYRDPVCGHWHVTSQERRT